jgi:hypothetical protein
MWSNSLSPSSYTSNHLNSSDSSWLTHKGIPPWEFLHLNASTQITLLISLLCLNLCSCTSSSTEPPFLNQSPPPIKQNPLSPTDCIAWFIRCQGKIDFSISSSFTSIIFVAVNLQKGSKTFRWMFIMLWGLHKFVQISFRLTSSTLLQPPGPPIFVSASY